MAGCGYPALPTGGEMNTTETTRIDSGHIRNWVCAVAEDLGEDCPNRFTIPDCKSWAELLAFLEDHNWHRLYTECQRRLQVPESEVLAALKSL